MQATFGEFLLLQQQTLNLMLQQQQQQLLTGPQFSFCRYFTIGPSHDRF